jgi:thiol-disulfide isomerase/thioredoxin
MRGVTAVAASCFLAACGSTKVSTTATSGASSTTTGGKGGGECIGIKPPAEAYMKQPGPLLPGIGGAGGMGGEGGMSAGAGGMIGLGGAGGLGAGGSSQPPDPKAIGATMPKFWLKDFQPQSCGHGAVYGPDLFVGQVTVVALWAAWCGYCQAQSGKMEQMRLELKQAGHKVHIVAVNKIDAQEDQQKLVDRCSFPLIQDLDAVQAWTVHYQGFKDDIFIYDAKGKLADFFSAGGERTQNLSSAEGYKNVKDAILAALKAK